MADIPVFISWSGPAGALLAQKLANTILDYGRLKPWVSGNDIRVGKPWREELDAALKGATAAVGILTPAALRSPWVNFEAGYLYSRLASFVPLRLSHEISGP